jgi:hypothetical protein
LLSAQSGDQHLLRADRSTPFRNQAVTPERAPTCVHVAWLSQPHGSGRNRPALSGYASERGSAAGGPPAQVETKLGRTCLLGTEVHQLGRWIRTRPERLSDLRPACSPRRRERSYDVLSHPAPPPPPTTATQPDRRSFGFAHELRSTRRGSAATIARPLGHKFGHTRRETALQKISGGPFSLVASYRAAPPRVASITLAHRQINAKPAPPRT